MIFSRRSFSIWRCAGPVLASLFAILGAQQAVAEQSAGDADLAAELAETKKALARLELIVLDLEARLTEREDKTPVANSVANPVIPHVTATVTDLEERVEELETIAIDVDDKVGSRSLVSAFDATRFDIGGFFDSAATVAIGEDNTEASFNRQVFELLFKAKLGPDWELFVAQAFVRNAPLAFNDPSTHRSPVFANNNSPIATDTVIAWGQYSHSDVLNLQFGRFITPQGIINIEHFPASLLDPEQPMFLRPFPGQTIFANFTNGLNLHGAVFLGERGENKLSYAAYGGVWAGNLSSAAFGGRLAYAHTGTGITLGVNGSSGDRSSLVTGDRFYAGGLDLLIDRGRLLWKSEIFYTDEGAGGNRLAYYTQPAIRITDNLLVFYRYDYLDTGLPGGESTENVAGIVFNPITNVRLRAIYRHRYFHDAAAISSANVDVVQFSSTLNV